MSEHGQRALVLVLLAASLLLVMRGPPRAEPLGPWEAAEPCEVAVERAGEGVLCLDAEEAEGRGWQGGDRLVPDGGVGRMAPERLELFAAPVDLNRAPLEELESLPGVGKGLAARIAAARPFSSLEALAEVPGIGARRFRLLRPRLRLEAASDGGAPATDGEPIE